MEKITGFEAPDQVPSKVLLIYKAVEKLVAAGEDINVVRVAAITELAGIGKGTAYDYFETKEELLACSLLYQMRKLAGELREIFSEDKSFAQQIRNCLDEMESAEEKRKYFLRYVHIMTADSAYCQIVREKMCRKEFVSFLPLTVLREAVERGIQAGELRRDIPAEYVATSAISKLLTYLIVIVTHEEGMGEGLQCTPLMMREYLYQSLMAEVGISG